VIEGNYLDRKKKSYFRNFKKKLTSKNRPPDRKNRKRTGPERIMIEILRSLYIDFEVEYPIYFAGEWKVYDFRIEDKLLIEVDGNYWHGKVDKESKIRVSKFYQLKNKKNDHLKNFIAKRNGYEMLRFWETDLLDNREVVASKILEVLNEAIKEKSDEDKRIC